MFFSQLLVILALFLHLSTTTAAITPGQKAAPAISKAQKTPSMTTLVTKTSLAGAKQAQTPTNSKLANSKSDPKLCRTIIITTLNGPASTSTYCPTGSLSTPTAYPSGVTPVKNAAFQPTVTITVPSGGAPGLRVVSVNSKAAYRAMSSLDAYWSSRQHKKMKTLGTYSVCSSGCGTVVKTRGQGVKAKATGKKGGK